MQLDLHPLTLVFRDPALEAEFRSQRLGRRSRRQTAVSFGVAILTWLVLTWIGSALLPELRGTLIALFIGGNAPLLALCAVLQFREPFATRLWPELALLSAMVPGASILAGQWLMGRAYDSFGCMILVSYLVMVHVFMGLRSVEALVVTAALCFGWVLGLHGLSPPEFLLDAVMPAGTALMGMRVSRTEERYRRRDFLAQRLLRAEQEKSERLVLNMLPAPIAQRLKEDRSAIADRFGDVTILFADIVGFTQLSQRLDPAQLVKVLNSIFSEFDELADLHGLEKIKTIGDAYMVAGGIPTPRPDHARAVAEMALSLGAVLGRQQELGPLQMRVGLHTGEVVAGVIGKRKFVYDLWGDAVNTASRMESHGTAGSVHVSEASYLALRDDFELEERGVIEVKGKGPMRTYWLKGKRK